MVGESVDISSGNARWSTANGIGTWIKDYSAGDHIISQLSSGLRLLNQKILVTVSSAHAPAEVAWRKADKL